jgi:hypothetical protein
VHARCWFIVSATQRYTAVLLQHPILFITCVFCHSYTNQESARNRDRVIQVHEFSRASKASLHALLSAEDEDGLDEDEFPTQTGPSAK